MSGRYWRVVVSIDGEEVLAIEPNMLAGIPNIDDFADEVRDAGRNLLNFIGTGVPSDFLSDEDLVVASALDGSELNGWRR